MHLKSISLLFLLISTLISAQDKTEIRIVDEYSKNPVFGATIFVNNKPLGYSDDLGNYTLALKTFSEQDEICVTHISYTKKCFSYADLLNEKVIYLTRSTTFLEEIVINTNKSTIEKVKPLLRANKKRYKKTKSGFHWSEMNFKKMVYREDDPQNYVEMNGFIFMIDNSKKRNPFIMPIIVPSEVRRTEETEFQKNQDYKRNQKKGVLQSSIHTIGANSTFFYRVFENLHPLQNSLGKYNFKYLEQGKENEGVNVYTIEY